MAEVKKTKKKLEVLTVLNDEVFLSKFPDRLREKITRHKMSKFDKLNVQNK